MSRGPSPVEWEAQKAIIGTLWIDEDKTLTEVMQCMKDRGFQASSMQYTRQLQKWKMSKNLREEEWIFISREINRRSDLGKQTQVLFYGRSLSKNKIRKGTRRHDRPTLRPTPARHDLPNIRLCTPPKSPCNSSREIDGANFEILPSLEFLRLVDSKSNKT